MGALALVRLPTPGLMVTHTAVCGLYLSPTVSSSLWSCQQPCLFPQGLPILVTVLISSVPRQVGGWLRGQERPVMSSYPCFLPFSWKEVISSRRNGESGSPTQGMAGLGVTTQRCEHRVVA